MMMKAGHREVREPGPVPRPVNVPIAGGWDVLAGRAVSGALAMPGYGVAPVE